MKTKGKVILWMVMVCFLIMFGCSTGGDDEDPPQGLECDPYTTQICGPCEGGLDGTQVCNAAGDAWDACICPELACTPGSENECEEDTWGHPGYQICNDDGTTWGICEHDPVCTVTVATNKDAATFTVTDHKGDIDTGSGTDATFGGVRAGNISISYQSVSGYCTPGFGNLPVGEGNTVLFTANYHKGCNSNIIINTNNADASFILFGPEIYLGYGTRWELANVPEGEYTIVFNDLPDPCYIKPSMTQKAVPAGETLVMDVSYTYDGSCSPGDEIVWYKDADGDGISDGNTKSAVERPAGGKYFKAVELIAVYGDCDDNDSTRYPGAEEICDDNIDNDCDTFVDLNDSYCQDPEPICTDADGDYFFAEANCGTRVDCDDGDSNEKPGQSWYKDGDDDGYYNGEIITQCERPVDHKTESELTDTSIDCDDNDPDVHDDCEINLDEGLVAYYPFNGNANDESGNGNDGTVYGSTLTEDRYGNTESAYSFDGNDYINISDSNSLTLDNITISAWIEMEDMYYNAGYYFSPIILRDDHNSNNRAWALYLGTNDLNSIMLSTGISTTGLAEPYPYFSATAEYGSISATRSRWVNVTFSYNGEKSKVYLNGSLKREEIWNNSVPGNIYHSNCAIQIGARNYPNTYIGYFIGKIDDIRIYNRALSNYEIQAIFDDQDDDGISNDGDSNGIPGDNPCTSGEMENCDDNCPNSYNPDQTDADGNGVGDVCENQTVTCTDGDGDGYGNPASSLCTHPELDCNDGDPNINPGAVEYCDGEDNDCNAGTSDGSGEDWSGELCDGASDSDNCMEGEFVCSGGQKTCTDNSGDSIEICNNIDDDCDGTVDEDLARSTSCGVGACAGTGIETCSAGLWINDTCTPGTPSTEICDNIDNNCDGTVDEEITRQTTCGVGACSDCTGLETCNEGDWVGDICDPFCAATEETCNSIDDDCDGYMDEEMICGTAVGGRISENTVWQSADSPFIVTESVIVDQGITLIIEPGVVVMFQDTNALRVDGTLLARGTDSEYITFTWAAEGVHWGYLYFSDLSTDAVFDIDGNYTSGCILEYCIVEHAGGADVEYNGAVRLASAHPFINRSTIINNISSGIFASNLNSHLRLENNFISENDSSENNDSGGAIYIDEGPNSQCNVQIKNNIITNNIGDGHGGGIFIESGTEVNIEYNIISNNIARMGGGIYVGLEGYVNVIGNILNSNLASYYPTGTSGYGGGIRVQYTSALIKDNIFYGNSSMGNGGAISLNHSVTIENNAIIANVAVNAPVVNLSSFATFSQNMVLNNSTTEVSESSAILAKSYSTVQGNNILGNYTVNELYNESSEGSAVINAENNWWGVNTAADIEDKIYHYIDDPTKALIDFEPWAETILSDPPVSPPSGLIIDTGIGEFTISWAPNPESDLSGYILYWGDYSGFPYSESTDMGNTTSYTISGLDSGTYYVTLTAYDTNYDSSNDDPETIVNENQTNGNESWYAEEIEVTLP